MSHLFNLSYTGKTTSGKETFGQFIKSDSAGNYILNKKSKYLYYKLNPYSPKSITVSNQGEYLLLKRANYLKYLTNSDNIKSIKTNLTNGLITKMDLKGVYVIQNNSTGSSPTTLSTTSTPYLNYKIDPLGSLFGNTTCGLNNYENYVVYNDEEYHNAPSINDGCSSCGNTSSNSL